MKKELLFNAFKTALIFVAVIWVVYLIDLIIPYNFNNLGLLPRSISGLKGVVFAPFIHANLFHILSNSLPLFLLSLILFIFYPKISWVVIVLSVILGGIGVWLIGRTSFHVGASGLIYAMAAFLITSGFVARSIKSLVLSLFVIVVYGGLVWGVFPSLYRPYVSWEGHLMGALAGVFIAIMYFKRNKPTEQPER